MIRDACPICESSQLFLMLALPSVPVHQNLVFDNPRDALAERRGDLEMCVCERCGFVFNRTFDVDRLEYGPRYENTQLASHVVQEYVAGLVDLVAARSGRADAHIVEVGCGNGAFIRAIVAAGDLTRGIGFDPSYVGPDVELDGRLRFERRYYDATCTDVPADVVVCRHVIEHVPDPSSLLRSFAAALRDRPGARIFLETPCVEWILRNRVVWDVFYEHCSLFTAASLSAACASAGFTVESVNHVFGGQYLWLEAINTPPARVRYDSGEIPALARAFAASFREQVLHWERAVDELTQSRTLAVWGAAAKGSTFTNLVDPTRERFACVVDMNPAKQGAFLGGTGHPIVRPSKLAEYNVSTVVILNPNYVEEIRNEIARQRLDVEIVNLGSACA